jgi:hypothetical protein
LKPVFLYRQTADDTPGQRYAIGTDQFLFASDLVSDKVNRARNWPAANGASIPPRCQQRAKTKTGHQQENPKVSPVVLHDLILRGKLPAATESTGFLARFNPKHLPRQISPAI